MNLPVIIVDIETMVEYFLCTCYDPQLDEWYEFDVGEEGDNLEKMVEYFDSKPDHYFVTYNGLRFDSQVLEFIIRNYHKWADKPCLEVSAIIAQYAQDTIDNSNYGVLPVYRENQLSFKILDLFEIHHYSNKNRMVSLKRLQFEMDLENIEEMPIHHLKRGMTLEERKLTREYCKNDVMSTYKFYLVTIGQTDHPLYKGNNQIELRLDIEKEFGIPCMNYSDSKIGDEIIKKYYCEERKMDPKLLPKKGFFRKTIHVKNCIAKYIQFKTVQLDQFLKKLKTMELGMNDDLKEHIRFYDNVYSFMKGGLHTENKPEVFEADDGHYIIDWDCSSYYPAIIIGNKQYPHHLGKEFLIGYEKMFKKRLELKPLAKTDKKIKGIVNALKLAVNSVYG